MDTSPTRSHVLLVLTLCACLVSHAHSASLLDSVGQGRKDKAVSDLQAAQKKVHTLCSCFDTNNCKTAWSKSNTDKSRSFTEQETQLLARRKQVCQAEKSMSLKQSAALGEIKNAVAQTWNFREQLQRIDYDMEALSQSEMVFKKQRDEIAYQKAIAGADPVYYPFDDSTAIGSSVYPFADSEASEGSGNAGQLDEYTEVDSVSSLDGMSDADFWNSLQSIHNETMRAINAGQMSAREAKAALAKLEAARQAHNRGAVSSYPSSQQSDSNSRATQAGAVKNSDCCYDVGLSDKTYGEALDRAFAKAVKVCRSKGSDLVPVDLFDQKVPNSGFKYKARLDYQCQKDLL